MPLAPRTAILSILLATLALTLALTGACTPSRTFVLDRPAIGAAHNGFTLKSIDSSIQVDPKAKADFESKLAAKLQDQLGTGPTPSGDLIIQYRFTLFDQGAGAARAASTIANVIGSPFYGIGDGAVGVEVVFTRPDGTKLGHILTDGSIAGAFGSTSSALDEAATSIAKYTKANFTCPSCAELGIRMAQETQVKGLRPM